MDLLTALLLGSVIASTDPSVLVPLFKTMSISKKLKQTIIAESAFNDAVGTITTFTLMGLIAGSAFSLSGTLLELVSSAFGGILVGLAVGFPASYLIAHRKHGIFSENSSEIGLATVISAYVLATHFEFSGFLAVFVVGMICGNKKIMGLWVPEEPFVTQLRFKEVLTMILRMMIFILLGANIDFVNLYANLGGALLVVGVLIFVARPLSVLVSIPWDRSAKWTLREVIYLMWVRETGVIPAALAGMMVAAKVPGAELISSVTFAAIFITLTFQASTAKLLAHLLKLDVAPVLETVQKEAGPQMLVLSPRAH
jgi:NhaP-type Na+/H+ or K+/H+ antiporter